MQERRETFGADKQDGGTGPQPLRETFSQPVAADPGAEARREALRAAFAREEQATRLTGEELRRAMREPERPGPERGQGQDRGHELER